mgnify:CR=1 FL=1
MMKDYNGKVVLITGGTKGIGLATGLAFGRMGAQLWLTHRWGSANEDDIRAQFAAVGAPAPMIVEADASKGKETLALLEQIKSKHDAVDVLINNVAMVVKGDGVMNHTARALHRSLDYSAWPFVDYLQGIKKTFDAFPSYAVATSSDGADVHYPNYDYVGVSKAVLECFARYMATHLQAEGTKVNVLRTRQVATDSYKEIFGDSNVELGEKFSEWSVTTEECANTIVALCSGLFDSMSGQVVTLDKGATYVDNMFTLGSRLFPAPEAGATGEEASNG